MEEKVWWSADDQAKQFKELEKENSRFERQLAAAELDRAILWETAADVLPEACMSDHVVNLPPTPCPLADQALDMLIPPEPAGARGRSRPVAAGLQPRAAARGLFPSTLTRTGRDTGEESSQLQCLLGGATTAARP